MNTAKPFNILILCTANSARSILSEVIANNVGGGRLKAYSAGSHPRGEPNPDALALIAGKGIDITQLRSKSWEEFAGPEAPQMDLVITVCDNAAGESCPIWPGAPLKAHWGIADPAGKGETESERQSAFQVAWDLLEARFRALVAEPFESMTIEAQRDLLSRIGAMDGATELSRTQQV